MWGMNVWDEWVEMDGLNEKPKTPFPPPGFAQPHACMHVFIFQRLVVSLACSLIRWDGEFESKKYLSL
jgi:hypothetical protein